MTEITVSTDQWKTGGNCFACRRFKYCNFQANPCRQHRIYIQQNIERIQEAIRTRPTQEERIQRFEALQEGEKENGQGDCGTEGVEPGRCKEDQVGDNDIPGGSESRGLHAGSYAE